MNAQAKNIDHVEKAKNVVSRNLFIFLTVVLGSLGTLNLIQDDINMYPLLAGASVSLLCLILLKVTKNYKAPAYIGMILAFGLTIYNMNVTSNFGHFVDFFWIIVIAIYVFFVLGNVVGVINLFFNIGAVVVIFLMAKTGKIEIIEKEYTAFAQVNFIINVAVSGIVFSYITIKVLTALQKSQHSVEDANVELTKSNEEKTIMLKEIHHRVKNNLQVITSLLRLQLRELEDENLKHHFTDSINRVSAMAIIHEKMYQNENLSRIDLESYVNSLVKDLISSYAVEVDIETSITSNVHKMEPENIVPLALIFNELISNSLEHAFKGRNQGKITVDIHRNEFDITSIHYSDDGIWKHRDKHHSFGLELIQTFVDQLDGSHNMLTNDKGTHYNFKFNKIL